MIITAYQEEAKRTMNRDLGPQQQIAVMMLGIYGESGELQTLILNPPENMKDRIKDEAGDLFWYITNTCNEFRIDLEELFFIGPYENIEIDKLMDKLMEAGAKVADMVKKWVGQGHSLDRVKLIDGLKWLVRYLRAILEHYGLTVQETLEYNLLKLAKRYPEGKFIAERSIGREIQE